MSRLRLNRVQTNKLETESSWWMRRMASPRRPATGIAVVLTQPAALSLNGMVLAASTSEMAEELIRSMAGPMNTDSPIFLARRW